MSRTLPSRSSLLHLKNEAKDLLKAMQAGDATAMVRIRVQLPRFGGNAAPAFTLATAQYVVAREYGFASWSKLKHHLDTLEMPKVTANDRPKPGMVMPVPRQRHAHPLVMAEHLRRKPHTDVWIEHALHDPSIRVRRDVIAGLAELCYDDRIIATLQTIIDTETDELLQGNARWALKQQRSKS